MYQGNSRFEQLSENLVTELISFQTQLFYDPTTQGCRVIFNGAPYMRITKPSGENAYVRVGESTDLLHVDLGPKMTNIVGRNGDVDPVSGADLSQISVYGVLILMKRAYDNMHNERAQELAAVNTPPSGDGGQTSTEEPPAEDPPADTPPADTPPSDAPPADEPPAEEPPADEPPAEDPPTDTPPADEPPAEDPPADPAP